MRLLLAATLATLALPALSIAADGVAASASAPGAVTLASNAAAAGVPAGPLATPPADKAQIVFLDPSNGIANAFPPAVYDVGASPRTFIAKLGAHVNAATLVAPGHHLFMVRTGVVTQFMEATVEAGHRYYVLARFVYGRGFQLRPLHPAAAARTSEYSTANPKFKAWVTDATWPSHTDEMPAGTDAAQFGARLDEHQATGLSEWSSKTAEQKAELTLTPADAFDD
jgi:hypothetical protein